MTSLDWHFDYINERLMVCEGHNGPPYLGAFTLDHAIRMQQEIVELQEELNKVHEQFKQLESRSD